MTPQDFNEPTTYPFDMLRGYTDAGEKESLLTYILVQCVKAKEWINVQCNFVPSGMVADGLLEDLGNQSYCLTTKAKGLLYSVYGKN